MRIIHSCWQTPCSTLVFLFCCKIHRIKYTNPKYLNPLSLDRWLCLQTWDPIKTQSLTMIPRKVHLIPCQLPSIHRRKHDVLQPCISFCCLGALHACSCVACSPLCLPSAGNHALRFIHAVAYLSKLAMHHAPHGLLGFLFKGIWIISDLVQFLCRYEHSYIMFFVNTLFLLEMELLSHMSHAWLIF